MQYFSDQDIKDLIKQTLSGDLVAMKETMANQEYLDGLGKFVAKVHESVWAHGTPRDRSDPSIAVEVAAILAFIKS